MKPQASALRRVALTLAFALAATSAGTLSAHAQADPSKHWFTVFTKASVPTSKSACARVDIKFVKAPNMRENQLMSPPSGYTRVNKNSGVNRTGARGAWCPKTISAAACEEREKIRDRNVWHNWLAQQACATVWWNNTVLYDR